MVDHPPSPFLLVLFSRLLIITYEWNIRSVGKCRANKIGFYSEFLKLVNQLGMGSFIGLVRNQLCMVICIWKDSKVLQIVSTAIKSGCQEVQRRDGRSVLHIRCTNDILIYQKIWIVRT